MTLMPGCDMNLPARCAVGPSRTAPGSAKKEG